MKTVIWVTGRLGTGKTTLIKEYTKNDPYAEAIFVGQICREKFGSGEMAKSENPGAPEETESFVRQLVIDKFKTMPNESTLFVDGVPRKPSQVRWVVENFFTSGIENKFVYVFCEEHVRYARSRKRDEGSPEDLALMDARNRTESESYLRVIEEMGILNIRPDFHDNTEDSTVYTNSSYATEFTTEYIEGLYSYRKKFMDVVEGRATESVKMYSTDLKEMWEKHTYLSDKAINHLGIDTHKELYLPASTEDKMDVQCMSVDWARRFLRRLVEELQELEAHLPEHWWSKELADVRAARVELIDMWHFFLSAAQALGMSAEFFVKTYYEKRQINLDRWEKGYKKKDKNGVRDDAHIGSVKEK